jgi:hypothetical protein
MAVGGQVGQMPLLQKFAQIEPISGVFCTKPKQAV